MATETLLLGYKMAPSEAGKKGYFIEFAGHSIECHLGEELVLRINEDTGMLEFIRRVIEEKADV